MLRYHVRRIFHFKKLISIVKMVDIRWEALAA